MTPEERGQRTYLRKVREALLAAEIERRYTKDEILELYLNEIYYGNLAYGVEAAAETYFNKSASQLTLGEAAFLAGLPQAPSVYDIYTNRDTTLVRFQGVVMGMLALSTERHCIYVSNDPRAVCVDGPAQRTPSWISRTGLSIRRPSTCVTPTGCSTSVPSWKLASTHKPSIVPVLPSTPR